MNLIETRLANRHISLQGALSFVKTRLAVWRTRRALARLEAHQLQDVGITAAEAHREAQLTVWDVPANWVRR